MPFLMQKGIFFLSRAGVELVTFLNIDIKYKTGHHEAQKWLSIQSMHLNTDRLIHSQLGNK